MRFVISIFLLLSIAVELFSAEKIDCDANHYKNKPALITKLRGYLYTVYTSVAFGNNEIFKFNAIQDSNIFTRTTTDDKCCRTMNVSTLEGKGYFPYEIKSDKDCPTPLNEKARLKLVAEHKDANGSYCVIVWTCRKSREGLHAFCTKSRVSADQKKWISNQYKTLHSTALKVGQTTDLKNGKCFKKKDPF